MVVALGVGAVGGWSFLVGCNRGAGPRESDNSNGLVWLLEGVGEGVGEGLGLAPAL